MYAAAAGFSLAFQGLHFAGARGNVKDNEGRNALTYASRFGGQDILPLFVLLLRES